MRTYPDLSAAEPDARSADRYLLWLARDHRRAVALGMLYGTISMVAAALLPAVVGVAIDPGLTGKDRTALLAAAGGVLLLGMAQAAASILADRCALSSSLGSAYRTMQLVTKQAARLGAMLGEQRTTGQVVSVGVIDIKTIGDAIGITARAAGAAAAIVVIAAIMLATSWTLGLAILVGVPLMTSTLALAVRPLQARQQRLRIEQDDLATRAIDIVSGLRVLRGVGGEQALVERYRHESQRARRASVDVARVDAVLDAAATLLPGLLVALIVWLGANAVLEGRIDTGQLVALYGYAVFVALPMRRLTEAVSLILKGRVAAARVTELLALEPASSQGKGDVAPPDASQLVDPESGLVVRFGGMTGVACASSTDARLLADRLGRYGASEARWGEVRLSQVRLDEIRRRVLVEDDGARLFSGPLRRELDPAERAVGLERALAAASAGDVVAALPDGVDTPIAAAGRTFSGGEQQRLRLARALMADPDVLVLVEPTSAVDAHTEAQIAAGLAAARSDRTTVVFSTSPLVLRHADRVCYVEEARVRAEGTHEALLADDRYHRLVMRSHAP